MKKNIFRVRWYFLISIVIGFLVGSTIPASATAQFSFAGYAGGNTDQGAYAVIPYGNPTVSTGQSLEWVMADDGGISKYIQAGWIKRSSDSGPYSFVEWKCSTVCQYIHNSVSSGDHTYKVELISGTWYGYIDGTATDSVSASTLGMTNASRVLYSGETSDTLAQLGGTSNNHFHMYNLTFKNTSGTWYQVNTTSMNSITTSGTNYRASIGYTSPYTWVENWTN